MFNLFWVHPSNITSTLSTQGIFWFVSSSVSFTSFIIINLVSFTSSVKFVYVDYFASLLNSFISSKFLKSIFMEDHVTCKQRQFNFIFHLNAFSFFGLISLNSTSSTMLNRIGENEHSYLCPHLREKGFKFSVMMYLCVCHTRPLFYWHILLCKICWVFIIKGCWIFLKAFPASIEMTVWFLFLILFTQCIMFIDVCMFNHSCSSEMKLTWSQYRILLMCR